VDVRPSHLPSLTSLRFFAAFAVFSFHASVADPVITGGGLERVLKYLFAGGAAGVSFFFVLSGFVLTWTVRPNDAPRRFWRRRAAKVYPNHIVTWTIVLAALVATHKQVTAGAAAASAGLLQAWIPDQSVYFAVNTPSWSLSCEMFFYLLFPAVIFVLRRLSTDRLRIAAVLFGAAPAALATASQASPDRYAYWELYVFPPVRLVEFCLGVTLAILVRRNAIPRIPVVPAAILAAGALVLAGHVPWRWGFAAVVAIPAAALICATAQRDISGKSAALLHRSWLIRLGEASFALYLVHQIVLRLEPERIKSSIMGAALLVVIFAFTVAWALAQYRWFEAPLYRRLSKPRPRRTAKHAVARGSRISRLSEGPSRVAPAPAFDRTIS
jgi:peptidoglycan/LPS O-acetylase OafA/YrhL